MSELPERVTTLEAQRKADLGLLNKIGQTQAEHSVQLRGLERSTDDLVATVRVLDTSTEGIAEAVQRQSTTLAKHDRQLDTIERTVDDHTTMLRAQGQQLADLEVRLGSVDTQLGSVDTRLGSVDTQLGSVDTRLGSVEGKLDRVIDLLGGSGEPR